MDHFQYRNGELSAESVPLARIAAEVGTPFYCYASATLERHYRVFAAAFEGLDAMVCYSVKANGNLAIIGTLARLGAGADVVSGGELKRAIAAGVPPDKIVFSGVGKSREELAAALTAGIMQINVESDAELELLSETAQRLRTNAPTAIRINPNVDAKTHAKITTGKGENKFGIDWRRAREVYRRAAGLPGIEIVGIAVHIGSQLTELEPYKEAYGRMRELVLALKADGHAIQRLDLGGGLGVPYASENDERPIPPPAKYGALVKESLGDLECRFILEPGRLIVGNAGVLVTRVLYVKEGESRTFVIVDAAMNDLIRPALYNAYHAIVPVQEPRPGTETLDVEVVGPICETGDTFGKNHRLPALHSGDLLAIRTAGAYGAVMASTYNGRPLVPEVLAKDDSFAVVRRRVSVEDAMQWESIPSWLDPQAKPKRKALT
ncbi:MAG: diaminopimelate decarboxylase [Rhodospirillales bacterium]|nr:diaminopimelate decarboxylase [Rhodospirillales bacterium]